MSPSPRDDQTHDPPHDPSHAPSPDPDRRDALIDGPARRRGAGLNPGNRFESHRLHVLGEEVDRRRAQRVAEGRDPDEPTRVEREVVADHTRQIIHTVQSTSDMPFGYTVNPYRGCEHGCIYCFARPYHEYLGFSSGLDFETKIVAKHDAPAMLVKELGHPKWRGEPILMSAITDIYQPLEKELELARRCLEVMVQCGQPVTTMTKSALALRDTDLWAKAAARNTGRAVVTLVTLDHQLAAQLEPRAASPSRRLHVVRELSKAGVPVTVNVAPVIPGLTDVELPAILQAAAEAGAKRAAWVLLRLPYQLKELFTDWLERCVPDRAEHVLSLLRQASGGKLYDARLEHRRRGQGPHLKQIAQNFEVFTRKHGLNRNVQPLSRKHFRPPERGGQIALF